MADIEVYLKNQAHVSTTTGADIIAAHGKRGTSIILDGPYLTVRLRLDPEETARLARRLLSMPEPDGPKGGPSHDSPEQRHP